MKRAFKLLSAVGILGLVLLAPLGASAATAACGKDQVTLGLPLIPGSKCVDNTAASGGAIVVYLRQLLTLLGGAVGLVIVLMLIVGGIQYLTSLGDPSAIKAGKERIVNAIIALFLFLMMYAILQFLIPGGILS